MSREGTDQDYKISFDQDDPASLVKLIKDLVAMANCGGGRIIIGRSETDRPGLDDSLVTILDSATVTDFAGKYIQPLSLNIAHSIDTLVNGKKIITLEVSAAPYPIVMSRQGTWKGADSKKDSPLFRKGEIWTRHSSKTERVTHEDLRDWINSARKAERESIMNRLTTYVNLPEGTSLQVVSPSGLTIDSPKWLLEIARQLRQRDSSHLLSLDDILWIFLQRDSLDLDIEDLAILIASSLRRNATLFWWLSQVDNDLDLVPLEIFSVFRSKDRDKSDASSSIVELGAIYIKDDSKLKSLIEELRSSTYKHFRDAAKSWAGRAEELAKFTTRITSAKHESQYLLDLSNSELEQLATQLATILSDSKSATRSRKLGDVTRIIWAKTTKYGQALLSDTVT